jgi:hypothetical protein
VQFQISQQLDNAHLALSNLQKGDQGVNFVRQELSVTMLANLHHTNASQVSPASMRAVLLLLNHARLALSALLPLLQTLLLQQFRMDASPAYVA